MDQSDLDEITSLEQRIREQAAEIAELREDNERQVAEIEEMATALENEVRWRREQGRESASLRLALVEEGKTFRAEIAALREAVRDLDFYTLIDALKQAEAHGVPNAFDLRSMIHAWRDIPAVRRALEEER